MLRSQNENVIILGNNNFACTAIKSIINSHIPSASMIIYDSPEEMLNALHSPDRIEKVFIFFDIRDPQHFQILDILTSNHKNINIIACIINPTVYVVLLMLNMGVKTLASYTDSIATINELIVSCSSRRYISTSIMELLKRKRVRLTSHVDYFTPRERCILTCLMSGIPLKRIALKQNVSIKTIYSHKTNIAKKVSVQKFHQIMKQL